MFMKRNFMFMVVVGFSLLLSTVVLTGFRMPTTSFVADNIVSALGAETSCVCGCPSGVDGRKNETRTKIGCCSFLNSGSKYHVTGTNTRCYSSLGICDNGPGECTFDVDYEDCVILTFCQ